MSAGKSQRAFRSATPQPSGQSTDTFVFPIRFGVFLLLLLGPIKFGSPTGLPEVPLFPMGTAMWLFFSWPPSLFPLLAGGLLLASSLLLKPPEDVMQLPALLWLATAIAALLGLVHCSTHDFSILQCAHFFGMAAFALVVFQLLENRPDIGKPLLGAVLIATALVAIYGYHQYFYGLQETRNYVYEQELKTGVRISKELRERLCINHIFSFFAISNSFAAHLILTLPVCAWGAAAYLWKALPSRLLSALGAMAVALFLGGALALTGSRAAFVSLACALGGGAMVAIIRQLASKDLRRNRKIFAVCATALCCLILAAGAAALIIAKFPKGTSSFSTRADYYRVGIELTLQYPFCGVGWGDFFHNYCTMKQFGGEESPHNAHNFPLMMGSETGLLGLLASVVLLLAPALLLLVKFWQSRDDEPVQRYLPLAVLTGWCAWSLHNLMDVDIQIPGTCATAIAIVGVALLDGNKMSVPFFRNIPCIRHWRTAALCAAAVAVVLPLWRLPAEIAYQALSDLCAPQQMTAQEASTRVGVWEVREQLSTCAKLAPYSPFPWATAGAWAQQRGLWPLAEEFYSEAAKRSPMRASYYYRLAMSQALQGPEKRDEARRNFAEASKLFPFAYGKDALREKLLKTGIKEKFE